MTRPDVVTAGEVMMALRWSESMVLGRPAQTTVAGAESNVAICLARLGHSASFVGRVGDDQPGELVLRTLRAEGVLTRYVTRDAGAGTGLVMFDRPVAGSVQVTYRRNDSAGSRLTVDDVLPALEPSPRILHVTGISLAIGPSSAEAIRKAAHACRAAGVIVSLDVNHRATLWSSEVAESELGTLTGLVDIAMGSPDELALLANLPAGAEVAERLMEAGIREVVTKLGPDGSSVYTAEGAFHQPALTVPEIDPVGAGDAFAAGYLSGYLDGLDPASRLRRGNLLGAAAVASHGDWEGAPRRRDLSLFTGGHEMIQR
jgi:2-dehydro-3-deoxygluconokinase